MSIYITTERWIFNCSEERERISCLKFGVDGQFFRVVGIAKIGGKCYIVDDIKKEIRVNGTLLDTTKKYISETYGKIENVVIRD